MARNGKVIVAMSGGVDSSVAACLLKQQGYDCVGVFMRVGAYAMDDGDSCCAGAQDGMLGREADKRVDGPHRLKHGGCSATDAIDARAIAGKLGIPFYALNFERDFGRIVDYFVDEYSRARTPNPCIMCNTTLKFGKLLRYADLTDAEFVATGHYARILRQNGQTCLARSLNRAKDQSYALFGIRRQDLTRCLFPVGEIADKNEVRQIADDLGLRVHDKPESQEICFVPQNDYKRLVRVRRPETLRPGQIRDSSGKVLGTHEGVANYTIGQRRGLGIAVGKPIYVTRLDGLTNTVTVGRREELLCGGLIADQVNWLTDAPTRQESAISNAKSDRRCVESRSFHGPEAHVTPVPIRAEIKIRHMHKPAPGSFQVRSNGDVEVTFDEPQPAVTPGQAAVFYGDHDVVLGGGWIREAFEGAG